jgi:predicted DNA-binding protein (UPF0251 family)
MARPKRCRRISSTPGSRYFKPKGIPLSAIEEVALSFDEYEAIRLADLNGLYQEQAAELMGVSRQTFGRIIESAHQKVAEALVKGRALKIEGGAVEAASVSAFRCGDCQHAWRLSGDTVQPEKCPSCESGDIRSVEKDKGPYRGCGTHRVRCFRETRNKWNKEK